MLSEEQIIVIRDNAKRAAYSSSTIVVDLCNALLAAQQELRNLVVANEQWNEAVESIIGKPPRTQWNDSYLNPARRALGDAT